MTRLSVSYYVRVRTSFARELDAMRNISRIVILRQSTLHRHRRINPCTSSFLALFSGISSQQATHIITTTSTEITEIFFPVVCGLRRAPVSFLNRCFTWTIVFLGSADTGKLCSTHTFISPKSSTQVPVVILSPDMNHPSTSLKYVM